MVRFDCNDSTGTETAVYPSRTIPSRHIKLLRGAIVTDRPIFVRIDSNGGGTEQQQELTSILVALYKQLVVFAEQVSEGRHDDEGRDSTCGY